jgi:hypothetical protein
MSEAVNVPFVVKMPSNRRKMKKQCKVFSVDENIEILAEVDTLELEVDLVAMLGLWISVLNTIVSKWSELEKSYSRRPLFSKEHISLKTLPLEEPSYWCSLKPILPTYLSMNPICRMRY